MNVYLMGLFSKWASIITLALASLFGVADSSENQSITVENINKTKNSRAETEVIPYETETIYNSELAKGTENVLVEGVNGIAYIINDEKEVVKNPITKKVEVGTKENEVFTGKMTGYGADCAGCSGVGNLSCPTKNGSRHSLLNHGMTYKDAEYGEIHILAAALDKFPCGTIIKVTHPNLGEFNAIVLDTGSAMNSAWSRGEILMDLAFVTQKDSSIHLSTTNNAKYEIQRWGW